MIGEMAKILTADKWASLSAESRQRIQMALVTAFVQGATWPMALTWGRAAEVVASGEAMARLRAGTLGVEG